jgi:hypothetical protein
MADIKVGDKKHMLIILGLGLVKNGRRGVLVQCDCGNIKVITKKHFGITKSCGCMIKINLSIRNTKHGLLSSKEWTSWRSMIKRCYYSKDKEFHNYGGRGILVCDKWKNSFISFYNDMGIAPNKSYSLDRINVNAGYDKENCRWATTFEQAYNKRNTKRISFMGEMLTIPEISFISNTPLKQLFNYINNHHGKLPESIRKNFDFRGRIFES